MQIQLNVLATDENFDERGYLDANPDVAGAVRGGAIASGCDHFRKFGRTEQRYIRLSSNISQLRAEKMRKLAPFLRDDLQFISNDGKVNYLSEELRDLAGIVDTEAVSAHGYDGNAMRLVEKYSGGLVLDCGAGKRDVYHSNVLNFEVVDYDTTDVLGVGEVLPFKDNSFEAVISVAVLEHVKDPFSCAHEISRVLKPGGELYCAVPLLQPLHGYPHHYYNMTHQGLRALFESKLVISGQDVLASTGPIWSLTWILQRWAVQLPLAARKEFESLRVADLMADAPTFLSASWVTQLPKEAQFELASATVLFATKPG